MIVIKKVSKSFGNYMALNEIDLEIATGDTVGLAGPSGSGKSTLLRCIQGLEVPDSGVISCSGRPGFMFQDFQLFPHMTVWENILYAPTTRKFLPQSLLEIKASELLLHLGVEQFKDRYPAGLSGGQKQRVALARTLIFNPDILLCDEPTSGLDVATTRDVAVLLKSIQRQKTTVIIASHDLDFLMQISHRIILLKNGGIASDIEPQKLANPIEYLKKLYE
ncbi:MAG: ATP-binding cassette domain-containing protein [Puniceicoccales bacterium]|jgi:polar amino acid transport system ATP-binding protein|nr:ATP-binding cassette domain-containing protein [Puniceicoccales bacterium]